MAVMAAKLVNRASIFSAIPPVQIFKPSPLPQTSTLRISSPNDSAEHEAERTAERVVNSSPNVHTNPLNKPSPISPHIARFANTIQQRSAPQLARSPDTSNSPPIRAARDLSSNNSTGNNLPPSLRQFMEPRFNADFSRVRIHTDERADQLSQQLNARSFTLGNQIYFARDQFQPNTREGQRLIAHELTHTIQQGASPQTSPTIQQQSPPQIQRDWLPSLPNPLNWLADKANLIPGFRMFTIVLGRNPINMSAVDRSPANILRALVEFIPGGALVTRALDEHGVFNKAADWISGQISAFGLVASSIKQAVTDFISSLGVRDLANLGGVWERGKRIFSEPINRIINFARGIIGDILRLIREAVLMPLARLAEGTRAWPLLCALLGSNPITGQSVPRTADTLLGGFMTLIGQQEIWNNLKRGNAVARAWAWFQGAIAGLLGFARTIPQQILATLRSITLQDVLTLGGLFRKVSSSFINIAGSFVSWGLAQVVSLLEILFSVVAPAAVPYIKRAQGAFHSILRNPIGFVNNLVQAGKLGFQLFARNIGQHLRTALINWLVGPLAEAGVYIPRSFSLIEIIKLVLSVLGLTWQNIRSKLLRIIPEPVLALLERTAGILVTLVREGPVAAWEQIRTELNELKAQLISQVTAMITSQIVQAAVVRLVSMLNPAGAVIQAILAIYNTISFFIERASQIAAVVGSFINSIAAIAAGQVMGAAQRVEQTMARSLTVVIAFLARFAGLGGIPARLVAIVQRIRRPIDQGLDKIVTWLGNLLQRMGGAIRAGARRLLNWWTKRRPVNGGGERHTLLFEGSKRNARLMLRSTPTPPSVFLQQTATEKRIDPNDSRAPITTAGSYETRINTLQTQLNDYEDRPDSARDTRETEANNLMSRLDGELSGLSGHIVTTLNTWKVSDVTISGISLPRGSFTIEQKRGIAAQHPNKAELKNNSDGELVNLNTDASGERLARRHVVSSHDIAKHYEQRLNGKKASEGKILLEQRTSIAEARTPVDKLDQASIQAAASARYGRFFGYLRNMFIGNSRENSSIQENIDRHHPDMAGQRLHEHVSHISRAWAFDSSITISSYSRL